MANKSIYIIYLHPNVMDERWSFLHRFFHPGIRENDKKYALIGFSLDMSHHAFLSANIRDFSSGENNKIHIPYIIVSMIEIPFHKNQLGFLHSKESLNKLENEKKT